MQYPFKFNINASDPATAGRKAQALAKLGGQFDAKTLEALAVKGKSFINHRVYGPAIRKELGI